MPPDRTSPPHGWTAQTADQTRLITDARGTEWEVYDEGTWSIGLAMEWDYLPQSENPGLVFVSRLDRRRLWPCPDQWRALSDEALLELLVGARSII